jgi:hypothetical protein
MPNFKGLTPAEAEVLIHKIKNSGAQHGDNFSEGLLSEHIQ